MSKNVTGRRGTNPDPLAWVDDAVRDERRKQGPTDLQMAFAELLNRIGRWDLFMTLTFKPNKKESVVTNEAGQYVMNENVRWCGGKRILKRLDPHTGLQKWGSPSVAPGWGKDATRRHVIKHLRRCAPATRWALFVESSKYRSCAHAHVLIANCQGLNWEQTMSRWQEKYGRADLEVVEEDKGVAHYLCKGYVAKDYGKSDNMIWEFSKNCRSPFDNRIDKFSYRIRQLCFRHARGNGQDENFDRLLKLSTDAFTTDCDAAEVVGLQHPIIRHD